MAHLVILDYSTVSVVQYEIPDNLDSEQTEEWINENTQHHLSNCSFMVSDVELELESGEL